MYTDAHFIFSSVNGDLSCFQLLTFVNNAVMSVSVQISVQIPDFNFLEHTPSSEMLDHMVHQCYFEMWSLSKETK